MMFSIRDVERALEAGSERLAEHFNVKAGNQNAYHDSGEDRLIYVVYANGELKPEGVMLKHMTDPLQAISDTVGAVIAAHPGGGTMWVRSSLDVNVWEDREEGEGGWPPAEKAGVSARIRFVVEPKK